MQHLLPVSPFYYVEWINVLQTLINDETMKHRKHIFFYIFIHLE